MLKKYIQDPVLLLLIAQNGYVIYYYQQHPEGIYTVVVLFWIQSVLIGVFNALNMATVKREERQGCITLFFLLHYMFFHFAYLVFLIPFVIAKHPIDWSFLQVSFWILLACSIIEFIQNKRNNKATPNIGAMFFMPYVRVVPMHLLILAPNFLKISAPVLFLYLKILVDTITYLIYRKNVYQQADA